MSYGFARLKAPAFTGFAATLEREPWSTLQKDFGHKDEADLRVVLEDHRRSLSSAIERLLVVQTGDPLDPLDATWDASERRLVAALALKLLDDDGTVVAHARQAQDALCKDGSTAMTGLDYEAEVDFGRTQVALARRPPLVGVLKSLGLTAYVDAIAVATDALDHGLRKAGGAMRLPPSKRLRFAINACAARFNHCIEGLDLKLDDAADPLLKAKLNALRAPLQALLDRHPADNTAADDAAPLPDDGPPAPTP